MSNALKLFAFDLDGTVLNCLPQITEKTAHALKRAHELGVVLAVSTGRSVHMVPDALLRECCADYMLSSNGARLTDVRTGELLFLKPLAADTALSIMDAAGKRGRAFNIQFERADVFELRSVLGEIGQGIKQTSDRLAAFKDFLRCTKTVVSARRAIKSKKYGAVEKLAVFCRNSQDRNGVIDAAGELCGTEGVYASDREAEITAAGVSKGSALCALCRKLGIPRENVAAIGDSGNDLSLCQAAGHFIAMGNAADEVKAAADSVTLSMREDGFAYALNRLLSDSCDWF